MEIILHDIKDSEVWAIKVKNDGVLHYTLHYDREKSEGVLHTEENLVYFYSFNSLKEFCKKNQLSLGGDEVAHEFDFDFEIGDVVPCKLVVEHWNLLAVMAHTLDIELDSAGKEYERLYAKLFELSGDYSLSAELDASEKERLEALFSGKNDILGKFIAYTE